MFYAWLIRLTISPLENKNPSKNKDVKNAFLYKLIKNVKKRFTFTSMPCITVSCSRHNMHYPMR